MTATGIPLSDLHLAWPDLWPLLEPAVKRTPDKPDVLARLIARDAQLWAVYEDGRPVAAIVTQITLKSLCDSDQSLSDSDQSLSDSDRPERRCRLWLIGACPERGRRGGRVGDWAGDFLGKLEDWARSLGCVALWGSGRDGWDRIVKAMGGTSIGTIAGFPAWERRL